MQTIAIKDANILIDCVDIDLLATVFQLPLVFKTTDFIWAEITSATQRETIQAFITDSTSYATSTNWYLRELTKLLDLDIGFPNAPNPQPVFLTNAVLCLKQGAMNASIPAKAYRACGTNFLRPLIELIEPQVVITLGNIAARATLRVFENEIPDAKELLRKNFRDIFQQSAIPVPGLGVTLFPVYHPGRLGQVNRQRIEPEKKSGWEWQQEDWRRIKVYLDMTAGIT